jgi:hypothetical protein
MTIVFIQAAEKLTIDLSICLLEELCRQKNYPYLVRDLNVDWNREDCRANADELWSDSRSQRVFVPFSSQFAWQQIISWLDECGFNEDLCWGQNVVFLEIVESESKLQDDNRLKFTDSRIFYQQTFFPRSTRFTSENLWNLWLFKKSWRDLCQRNSVLPYRIKESLRQWVKNSIEAFDRANIVNPVSVDVLSLIGSKPIDAIDW